MRHNSKTIISIIAICITVSLLVTCFVGCQKPAVHDPEYLHNVEAYKFWDNTAKESISQINISKRVRDFLNTAPTDGREKKVLVVGYDGARADLLGYDFDKETGEKLDKKSGILEALSDEGSGVYLAYAGGEFPGPQAQYTVTGAGWASILTGVWANKHKIMENMDVKNPKYTSFVLDAATGKFNNGKVYTSTFIGTTTMHFATQYLDEINYLRDHPKDGVIMPEKQEHKYFIKEKGKWSESLRKDRALEYVHAIAPNTTVPADYVFLDDQGENTEYPGNYVGDVYTRDAMISAINKGTDVIFGILDTTDHQGHHFGFSGPDGKHTKEYIDAFIYQEKLAADIVNAAKTRALEKNENWLIILTTDHGGYEKSHGQYSLEERTTWVACNQGFDSDYYAVNYTGYKDKK